MRREHDQSLFVMASNTFLWLTETNVLLTYWKADLPMEILDNLLHRYPLRFRSVASPNILDT